MLQEACIKIVGPAIYTYPFFLMHAVSSSDIKEKVVMISLVFFQQVRPQTIVQWYILERYSSVKIGFNMISKRHTRPIVYILLVQIH